MPQCKACFKPIASGDLCRPCREEQTDSDDITQEFPTSPREDDGWMAPSMEEDEEESVFEPGQDFAPDEIAEWRRAWCEFLGLSTHR